MDKIDGIDMAPGPGQQRVEVEIELRLNGAQAKALRQLIRTATNKGANSEWWRELARPLAEVAQKLEVP